ncbi:Myc-type [Macleaya cordata]|uniref:Myc-type n=1 Tax=Macleaya cordata TaxID=56857 RepID=A0A200PNI8_MACCD|nr:Myc-type [Macleaya cordata]
MEKDYRLHQQNFHWQAPNLNCMSFVLDSGRRDFSPAYTNPYANMVSPNGSLPGFAVAGLPQFKVSQVNEPHGWFYGLPRHRHALTPMPDAVPKEFSTSPSGYGGGDVTNALPGSVQKKFLVFDQSGDHTSLFFSSAGGSHIQNPSYGHSKPFKTSGLYMEEPATKRELIHQAGPVICTELEENQETGDTSEMHEDTEELNALLYSDDEYDSDDEVSSTGHSPRDMTGYEKQGDDESAEEVASSACPTKRKRQFEEEHYTSSLVDTASSGQANESMECKDDAESSCGEGSRSQGEMELLLPANKRLRREKIRETVSILQSIIPGGKGKDAILVLDEAIQYLRSLKFKAKSVDMCSK